MPYKTKFLIFGLDQCRDPAQMKAIQKVFQSSLPKFVAVAKEVRRGPVTHLVLGLG